MEASPIPELEYMFSASFLDGGARINNRTTLRPILVGTLMWKPLRRCEPRRDFEAVEAALLTLLQPLAEPTKEAAAAP